MLWGTMHSNKDCQKVLWKVNKVCYFICLESVHIFIFYITVSYFYFVQSILPALLDLNQTVYVYKKLPSLIDV